MAGKIKRIVALVLAAALMFSLVDGRIYRVYATLSSASWNASASGDSESSSYSYSDKTETYTYTYNGKQQYPVLNKTSDGVQYYIYQESSEENSGEGYDNISDYKLLGNTSENSSISVDVGTYYVRATIESESYDSYDEDGGLYKYEIVQATNSVSVPVISNWTYGESPNKPKSTATFGTVYYYYYNSCTADELTYEKTYGSYKNTYSDGDDCMKDADAGTYWVQAVVAADSNGNYALSKSDYVEFTIDKAEYSNIAVSIEGWTYGEYDAEENSPSISDESISSDNITYTYYNSNEENLGTEAPTNAGTYYVEATIAATDNYNSYTTDKRKFTISKADNTYISVAWDSTEFTYNGSEQSPTATATVSNEYGGTDEFDTEKITYTYYYSDGTTVLESAPTNVGTYYVTATIAETTNYNSYTTDKRKFTISKADADGNIISVTYGENPTTTFTYNGSAQYPEATVTADSSLNCSTTITYYESDGTTEIGSTAPNAAGTYVVRTTVSSNNYDDVVKEIEYTINPVTLTASNVSISLNSKDYPVVTVTGVNSKALTENTDYTCTIKNNTADKSYTITVKGSGNYNGSVSIVKDKPTYTVTRTYEYYKSDGKTLYSSKTKTVTIGTEYVYGDEVTLTPTATGTQWKLLDSAETITVTGDTTVTFRYKLRQYTVTFKKLSGTTTKKVTVDYGTKIKISTQAKKLKSTALKRTNYVFSKWSVKTSSGPTKKSSSASVTIKGTTTITANWTNVKTKATKKNKTFRMTTVTTTSSGIKLKVNQTSGMDGYKIEISRSKSFKSKNTFYQKRTSSGKLSSTYTIKKNYLVDTKIYYIRVTAYYKDSKGNKITGKVSYSGKVKTKLYYAK